MGFRLYFDSAPAAWILDDLQTRLRLEYDDKTWPIPDHKFVGTEFDHSLFGEVEDHVVFCNG